MAHCSRQSWMQGGGSALAAVALVSFLAVVPWALATDFPVGGSGVWEFGEYQVWANKTNFHVGDKIVFTYSPGSHNVITLSQADYAACSVESFIKKYSSGLDTVTLDQEGTTYFSCGIPGHCSAMKFSVNVIAVANGPETYAPGPAPSAASSVRAALQLVTVVGAAVAALLINLE